MRDQEYQGSLIHHPEPTPHERQKRSDLIGQVVGGLLIAAAAISPFAILGIILLMRYGR